MYNNFSSKKTKKVISALLASALVVTSAPITADAATAKVLGVNKTFTKAGTKVSGLSAAEKKIVKVTINKKKKKVTVKGAKPGKATFKIGSKSYTFKVGAVKIKKKSFATTLTAGTNKKVTVTSSYGAKDKLAWSSSNKAIVKVANSTTTASAKKVGTNTLKPVKAGTATITVKSKNTGKKLSVKVTVKAAATPTAVPTEVPSGSATTAPTVEPTATATATTAPTEVPSGSATTAPTEVPSGSATTAPTEVPSGSATEAPTEAPTAVPTATPIAASATAVSATAVSSKKIAITFDRALTSEEIAGLKVDVTREKATQAIKFAVDGNTLYITRDSEAAFSAATYNVVVSGTVEAKADVAVAAPVAKSLDITSSVIVDGEGAAQVKVALLDQYGEEMTLSNSDFTIVATNKTQSGFNVNPTINSDGKLVIDTKTQDYKVNDEIQITMLHTSTGLSATKVLKVVEATYVTEITLDATPVLPTGATRLTENVKGVKIYYTAKDNYGDVVDLQEEADAYKIVSTNQDVLKDASISAKKDDAGKTYFELASFAGTGTTSLVALANKSGNTSKIDLTVLENAGEVYTAEFETTSVEVAQGSTAYIGVKFYDKYGDIVKAEDIKDALAYQSSDAGVKLDFEKDPAKDNYGKLAINATEDAKEDTTVIVTATVKNVPTVITVKVGKKAVPSNFTATATETALVVGGETKVELSVKDQYGSDANDLTGYEIKVSTGAAVSDVTVSGKAIYAKATAVGSHDMKIDLVNTKENKIVDTKTVKLTVVANTASNLTYTTDAIPTLYKKGAVDSDYAKEIKLTAKTSAGTVVAIPAEKILSVTSDNSAVVVDKKKDGKWVVYGKDTSMTTDVMANISIVVATDDGSTIIKTTATVSKDEKQYKEIKFVKDDAEVTAYTGTYDGVALDTLYAVDQFGVKNKVLATGNAGDLKVDAISLSSFSTAFANASDDTVKYDGSKLVFTDNGTEANGKITTLTAGTNGTVNVTFVVGALTKTITVTITSVDTKDDNKEDTPVAKPTINAITVSGTGVSGSAIAKAGVVTGSATTKDIADDATVTCEVVSESGVAVKEIVTVENAKVKNNELTFDIYTTDKVTKGTYTIKFTIAGATQTATFEVVDAPVAK